jgi:putative membrane protein
VRLPSIAAQLARGFSMGAADIVPGVSGGTVALVLGIYERLIGNIREGAAALRRLIMWRPDELAASLRRIEWTWLISLLVGILVAVAALASLLEGLLDDHPIQMAGLFLGLVLGAVVIAWRLLDRVDAATIAVVLLAAAAVFLLLGLRTDTTVDENAAEVVTEPVWTFFLAGAIAICAMILPGISGSFILVLLGMYTEVLGAVNDRDLLVLGVFALGCIVGLALFSTLLSWSLAHHHHWVMAGLIGLMLGSTRVLWPWPGGVETTTLARPSDPVAVPIALAVAGFLAVIAVEWIARRMADDRA